jgi:hypothetical protein
MKLKPAQTADLLHEATKRLAAAKPPSLTADTFIHFMERVWAMPCEPTPEGGIRIWMPDETLYDNYHDARRTAILFGARMGRLQYLDKQSWVVADMPEGGRVYIAIDGNAVRRVRARHEHHAPRA